MKVKKYWNSNLFIALRRKSKQSQQEVAEALGVSRRTICNWESGLTTPSQRQLEAIGAHFCIDWTFFVSKIEQVAWQNYQLGIIQGNVTDEEHQQHRQDAIALNALPAYQEPDVEPSETQQSDDDLLAEGEVPNVS